MFFISFLSIIPISIAPGSPITLAQQQEAQAKIAQLNTQKQQKQSQINTNNNQIVQNNLKIAELGAKTAMAGIQHASSTGIPTDIETSIKMADMADDIKRLRKANAELERQNQALQGEIQALDNAIGAQMSVLTKPTKAELEQDIANYGQTLKNHDDYINWLKNKGKSQQEIDDAIWIKKNDEMRQNQIKQQIQSGDYREPTPPSTVAPSTGLNQPSNPQGAWPGLSSQQQITHVIQDLQDQLAELQANPPPGWSPVGESVAGPSVPSIEAQIQSSQAAGQDIQASNEWDQQQQQIQSQIDTLQGWLQNGWLPPPDFDWNRWLQSHSRPPHPTGGSGGCCGSGESGHLHNPDGSDAD